MRDNITSQILNSYGKIYNRMPEKAQNAFIIGAFISFMAFIGIPVLIFLALFILSFIF